jgi:predicted alpha/beta superfamily hydrolase
MRSRLPLLFVLLILPAGATGAQPASGLSWATDVMQSPTLGKRTLYVATPDGYERGRRRYPVLVMLDADQRQLFQLALAQTAYLSDNDAAVPPMIVVGIANGADRIHDMTPPADGSSRAEFPNAGGAAAFTGFIVDEVLPRIRSRYRTLPTTVLAGHSAAGLFALYAAATRPHVFQGVIAISPALWFNDSLPARDFADRIATSAAAIRVFAASGGREPGIDVTTRRFAERLESAGGQTIAVEHREYANDTHALTPASALAAGLRFVFEPVWPQQLPIASLKKGADSAAVVRALAKSEEMYADSARALRLPKQLPERPVDHLGYWALETVGNADLALQVFRRNVELHPESARARASLADAYMAKGDTAAAVVELRRAVRIWRETGAELSAASRAKLLLLARKFHGRRGEGP